MPNKQLKILIVDDSHKDALLLAGILRRGGYEPVYERVDTGDAMRAALQNDDQWDVIVTDHNMPQFNSLKALEVLRESGLDIPIIIVSGAIGEDIAVTAMKAGANDYLLKDNLTRLVPAIDRELCEAGKRRSQRETQKQFEAIFNNVVDIIVIADDQGNFLDVNPAACELTGLSREELLQKNIVSVFFPSTEDTYLTLRHDFIAQGQQRGELTFVRPDGCVRYVDYTATANFLSGRHVAIMRDITERKLAEDTLRRNEQELLLYAEKLERSNRELEHFAVITSHDLQAPLRKVRLFSDYIKGQLGENVELEIHDSFERMERSISKMQNLITDLLQLSRITRKGRPFEHMDLAKVIREVTAEQSELIRTEKGRVEVGKMCDITADPGQIHQLFNNLISNGLKFHKPDVPPVVKVNAEVVGNYCEITVEDNGIGFDEKYLDRIFKIFQRLHGDREFPGNGIGLALCQKIVERHQGSIRAESAPGIGSKFIVSILLAPLLEPVS